MTTVAHAPRLASPPASSPLVRRSGSSRPVRDLARLLRRRPRPLPPPRPPSLARLLRRRPRSVPAGLPLLLLLLPPSAATRCSSILMLTPSFGVTTVTHAPRLASPPASSPLVRRSACSRPVRVLPRLLRRRHRPLSPPAPPVARPSPSSPTSLRPRRITSAVVNVYIYKKIYRLPYSCSYGQWGSRYCFDIDISDFK